jgi:hypothetical protein
MRRMLANVARNAIISCEDRSEGCLGLFLRGVDGNVRRMSLNRVEQMFSDYVGAHPEEKRFWEEKVRTVAAGAAEEHTAAAELERELGRYFKERAQVVPSFREVVAHHGSQRVSLRNLAELWLRQWTPPRPRPKAYPGDGTANGGQFISADGANERG